MLEKDKFIFISFTNLLCVNKKQTFQQYNWYEYAFEECKQIQKNKPQSWVQGSIKLLELMKKDIIVREFQHSELISLIYEIEIMDDVDYLVENQMDFSKDLLRRINKNKSLKVSGKSLFGNSQIKEELKDSLADSFITLRQKPSLQKEVPNYQEIRNIKGKESDNKQSQNLKTLVEDISIFEEELEVNVQRRKVDTNLMRSEIQTILDTQDLCILQNMGNALLNDGDEPSSSRNTNLNQSQLEKEDYLDALKMVNFYKRVTGFLEKSLERKGNPLRALIKQYKCNYFKKYSKALCKEEQKTQLSSGSEFNNQFSIHPYQKKKKSKQLSMVIKGDTEDQDIPIPSNIKCFVEEMITETQQFIQFILYCLIFFYDLDSILPQKAHSQLVNKENLWNILVNFFFDDERFSSVMLNLIKYSQQDSIKQLEAKFMNLKDAQPQCFEIHPQFCLNNLTVDWLLQKKKHTCPPHLIKQISNQDESTYQDKKEGIEEDADSKLTLSPCKDVKEVEQKISQPYYKAIQKLREVLQIKSPIHKMKIIGEFFSILIKCVQDFFIDCDYEEQNMIASDDLINILIYVIVKTQLPEIICQLKLISSFLSKQVLQTKIGYQCTSLQIAANYLEVSNLSRIRSAQNQQMSFVLLENSQSSNDKTIVEEQEQKESVIVFQIE